MKNRPILSLNSFKKDKEIIEIQKEKEQSNLQPKPETQKEVQKKEKPQKASKIPKQVRISDENFNLVYSYFNKNYPECFPSKSEPVPLAIGIHHQIRTIEDLPFSKSKIFKFLARYAKNALYREQLVVGNNRINLDGSVSSQVSEDEALQTKELLTKSNTNKVTTTKAKKERVAKNIQLPSLIMPSTSD
jgi:hypothetical protein